MSKDDPQKPTTDWFDELLACLVVGLAFLQASFPARNSDIWLHLATGRLIINGQFSFGHDPFSHGTDNLYWANANWLCDLTAYLIASLSGSLLVVLKAVVVALTTLLLLRLGRFKPTALVATVLAILAMTPSLELAAGRLSVFFLALTWLLLEGDLTRRKVWLIAGLFALWANVDRWFILGPLVVALRWLGDALEGAGTSKPKPWAYALGAGVLATLVNPHFVRIWSLPAEVASPATISALFSDPQLRGLVVGALSTAYISSPELGANICGLAYLALLLLSAAAVGWAGTAAVGRGTLLVWAFFAAFSIIHSPAIPFFAVVTVPILAQHLSGLLSIFGDWFTSFVRKYGRALALLVMVGLLVGSWAGRLQPAPAAGQEARRLGWAIEAEPSLVQTAKRLQAWRTNGELATEARGLLSVDLANYCAYFAPSERNFVDSRLNLHAGRWRTYADWRLYLRELGNVTARARAELFLGGSEETGYALVQRGGLIRQVIAEGLRQAGVQYVGLHEATRETLTPLLHAFWNARSEWQLLALPGRTALLAWRDPQMASAIRLPAELDWGRLAFGREVELVPMFAVPMPYKPAKSELFAPPPRVPPETDEAALALEYLDHLTERAMTNQRRWVAAWSALQVTSPAITGWAATVPLNYEWLLSPEDVHAFEATPLLCLRAARRAIAANPDDPEAYFWLARACAILGVRGDKADLRRTEIFAALSQGLARLPGSSLPDRRPHIVFAAFKQLYEERRAAGRAGWPANDLVLEAMQQLAAFFPIEKYADIRETWHKELADINADRPRVEQIVSQLRAAYESEAAGWPPSLRSELARRYGLARELMAALQASDVRRGGLAAQDELLTLRLRLLGEGSECRESLLNRPIVALPVESRIGFRLHQVYASVGAGDYTAAGHALDGAIQAADANPLSRHPAAAVMHLFPSNSPAEGLACVCRLNTFPNRWRWLPVVPDLHAMKAVVALSEGATGVARWHFNAALAPRDGYEIPFEASHRAQRYLQLLEHYGQ